MADRQNTHLLYKNLGETPNHCILRFKKANPGYSDIPMTYAGRLDPMAEGLLLCLSGEAVHEKEKYLDLSKTYMARILWGFETDTADLLGKVIKFESEKLKVIKEEIQEKLKNSIGKFEQSYPAYSSKPVQGRPLFQWAREGRLSEIEIPRHMVEIFNAQFISRKMISKEELLKDIISKISLVSGDFRQEEIIKSWNDTMSKCLFDSFTIDTISITVSSGFYVRQFVSDLAEAFKIKAATFHIKRIKVGDLQIIEDGD